MAIEIYDFTVTVPAGTPASAGFSAPLTIPARVVTQINIRVPPGPRGEVGFAIGSGGLNIVPVPAGTWIVTDNEDLVYPLDETITSGAWQLLAYNTGSFPHTLRVYLFTQLLASASAGSTTTLLPPGSISGTGTGDTGTGDTGTGTGDGGIGGITPPVITPPVITPPSISAPLILPPTFPAPPGQSGAGQAPVPDVLLIGVSGAGTVGLLTGGGYFPLLVQTDVDALAAAGIAGVSGDDALSAALAAASPAGSAGAAEVSGAGSE